MEKIRNLVVLFGLSLTLVALGATGARAQGFTMTGVGGAFTLSHEARWGTVTLPAGSYTLQYGYAGSGLPVVEVHGTANGGPHVIIAAQGQNQTSGTKNAIVCVREGSRLVVRELEMAAISESASFALPRGAQLTAKQSNGKKNIQLAEGPMLIQRIPITVNSR